MYEYLLIVHLNSFQLFTDTLQNCQCFPTLCTVYCKSLEVVLCSEARDACIYFFAYQWLQNIDSKAGPDVNMGFLFTENEIAATLLC